MNLYMYLPPHTAHQPGILESLVLGQVPNYWRQNSHIQDYKKYTELLYNRLAARGHPTEKPQEVFMKAAKKIDAINSKTSKPINSAENTLFIHEEYHPDQIPGFKLHQTFNNKCKTIQETLKLKMCVSHSRPKNVYDSISRTGLHQNKIKHTKASGVLFDILEERKRKTQEI